MVLSVSKSCRPVSLPSFERLAPSVERLSSTNLKDKQRGIGDLHLTQASPYLVCQSTNDSGVTGVPAVSRSYAPRQRNS